MLKVRLADILIRMFRFERVLTLVPRVGETDLSEAGQHFFGVSFCHVLYYLFSNLIFHYLEITRTI